MFAALSPSRYLALKTLTTLTLLPALLLLSASWIIAGRLSAPAVSSVGPLPGDAPFEQVEFAGTAGWYLRGRNENSCVLLLHGIRSDRREMLPLSRLLFDTGYSSLLIDLQAHGESPGQAITFGVRESAGARNAVRYLRQHRGCKRVVAVGRSLGGAAALLGPAPLDVEGYVLESVYPGIQAAVHNRLRTRLGPMGAVVAPLLYWQIPLRLDIGLEELQPAKAVRRVRAPVMIMNGTEDQRTTRQDTELIYANIPGQKSIIWFEGAGHANLFEFDKEKYQKVVLGFLQAIDRSPAI